MNAQIPRPKRTDDAIVKAAAMLLAPAVKQWAEETTSVEQIAEDLAKQIKYKDDGYEIARGLDGIYDPDSALVEILDNASGYKRQSLIKAEIEWVKATGIKEIPLGTKVRWPRKPEAGIGIVTNNHEEGKSTVTFSSIGQTHGYGYVVEWENLTIINED